MFKFLPNARLPGFRVGRPDDGELGFNVANDGSTPPVLPGVPDVPAVDDTYPFGATSPRLHGTAGTGPQSVCASRQRIATAPGRQSNAHDSDAVGRFLAA